MPTLRWLVAGYFFTFFCIVNGRKCYNGTKIKMFSSNDLISDNFTVAECEKEKQFCLRIAFSSEIFNLITGKRQFFLLCFRVFI